MYVMRCLDRRQRSLLVFTVHPSTYTSRFQHSLECIIRALDDPLSGRQRVGRSLKPPLVGVVTVQKSLFTYVACSDAVSCR